MKVSRLVALSMSGGFVLGCASVAGLHAQPKPPAYVVTELEILDEAALREFAPKLPPITQSFGGKYLARGRNIAAVEGTPPKSVIIIAFDSMEKAQAYRSSPAYRELLPLRDKAIKDRSYIVEGVAN